MLNAIGTTGFDIIGTNGYSSLDFKVLMTFKVQLQGLIQFLGGAVGRQSLTNWSNYGKYRVIRGADGYCVNRESGFYGQGLLKGQS